MVSSQNGAPAAVELETFLPRGTEAKVVGGSGDAESGRLRQISEKEWDPFANRKVAAPTTNCDTLTHLLKASLGTGILAMPDAFKHSGMALGIFFTIFVAFICTYCSYILVECAHVLYVRTRRTTMSFAEVAEVAFQTGPKSVRKYAPYSKFIILFGLFLTYFGTCSVYTVIIGANFAQVIDYYAYGGTDEHLDQRWIIGAMLVPLVLLSWVPNLKKLAPISMVANVFMGLSIGITFYYCVAPLGPLSEVPLTASPMKWPVFFSISIFAMEAIGVVMPLENNMATPRSFVGICGVLNQGMSGVTLIYILLGFMGYWRYGELCNGAITLNLAIEEIPAQIVKVLVALAVYCTYGLQFYVCLEIGWNAIKDRCTKNPRLCEYIMRTVLVVLSVVLAVAVPTISPFIGLLGAFCFSILGLICPAVIECVVHWESGLGQYNYLLWKNIVVGIIGSFALFFGTWTSVEGIINELSGGTTPTVTPTALNETATTILTTVTEAFAGVTS